MAISADELLGKFVAQLIQTGEVPVVAMPTQQLGDVAETSMKVEESSSTRRRRKLRNMAERGTDAEVEAAKRALQGGIALPGFV